MSPFQPPRPGKRSCVVAPGASLKTKYGLAGRRNRNKNGRRLDHRDGLSDDASGQRQPSAESLRPSSAPCSTLSRELARQIEQGLASCEGRHGGLAQHLRFSSTSSLTQSKSSRGGGAQNNASRSNATLRCRPLGNRVGKEVNCSHQTRTKGWGVKAEKRGTIR